MTDEEKKQLFRQFLVASLQGGVDTYKAKENAIDLVADLVVYEQDYLKTIDWRIKNRTADREEDIRDRKAAKAAEAAKKP